MRGECRVAVSETRKIRKPLMEKKRRARINDSLETLKQILLDAKANLHDSSINRSRKNQRTAKLEKADILEMTVHYIQNLHIRLDDIDNDKRNSCAGHNGNRREHDNAISRSPPVNANTNIISGDNTCANYDGIQVGVTLVPTRLANGEVAFVMPSKPLGSLKMGNYGDECHLNMWRPW